MNFTALASMTMIKWFYISRPLIIYWSEGYYLIPSFLPFLNHYLFLPFPFILVLSQVLHTLSYYSCLIFRSNKYYLIIISIGVRFLHDIRTKGLSKKVQYEEVGVSH